MRIALVDDDRAHIQTLSRLMSDALDAYGGISGSLTAFSCGEDFLAAFEKDAYDLIVLDIYMGAMTGVEVAYEIRKQDPNVLLVFCTSSNEFASECFDVGAKYYLRKPILPEDIQKMLARLNVDAMEAARSIRLPDGHAMRLRRILYTEYTNHVITVYSTAEPPHRLRTSQTEMEALLLPLHCFVSPYKGITVNLYAVQAMTNDTLTLTDGTTLPITRRKTKEIKAAYNQFRMNEMKKEMEKI